MISGGIGSLMKRISMFMAASWVAAVAIAASDPRIGPQSATPELKPPDAPMLSYHFVAKPVAPLGQRFGNVSAVALTPAGHLLVLNRNPQIMMVEYDAAGRFLRTFNPNIAVNTHGMRVDRHGNIWVIDSFLNVIWKLNPAGEPVMVLGKRGVTAAWTEGEWNGLFNQPLDVAFDMDDNVYVVQGHGGTSNPPACALCATYETVKLTVTQGSDARVLKLDPKGNLLASRSFDDGNGPYPTIHSVIVTPRGDVWVTDRQHNRIVVLNRGLQLLKEIQEPAHTSGLFVDARGQIWLSSGMDGMVMRLDGEGRITGWIGQAGRSDDPDSDLIGEAHYLVVTPDQKTIYVADSVNAKVLKLQRQ
jgi:DNA-binding beta-propeller fold protein YncE